MTLRRRRLLQISAAAAALPAPAPPRARAETYPSRTVRIIVATSAGRNDRRPRPHRRAVADRAQGGQSFVIENKPGGGNNIGVQYVVNAPAVGRLHDAARQPGQRHQRDAVQEPQLQFHPPTSCRSAIVMRSPPGHGGPSVGSRDHLLPEFIALTPRKTPARSTWGRPALEPSPTSPASCSR